MSRFRLITPALLGTLIVAWLLASAAIFLQLPKLEIGAFEPGDSAQLALDMMPRRPQ